MSEVEKECSSQWTFRWLDRLMAVSLAAIEKGLMKANSPISIKLDAELRQGIPESSKFFYHSSQLAIPKA